MKATKLIELLAKEVAEASRAGHSDVEVQLTDTFTYGGDAFEVGNVTFAEEIIVEEDENGKWVERATGLKAVFITQGCEPEHNSYNFLGIPAAESLARE